MHHTFSNNKGQTLVETIIAVTILLAGIVTSLTLGIVTIRAGQVSQNRTIADNLAREGIELVRNIRDTNWLLDEDWDLGWCASDDFTAIPDFLPDTSTWSLDFGTDAITESTAEVLIRQDRESPTRPLDYYMQTSGARPSDSSPSMFRRLITLTPDDGTCVDADDSYTVRVDVEWSDSGTTHRATLEEQLFDWKI